MADIPERSPIAQSAISALLLAFNAGTDLVAGYRVGLPVPGWLSLWDGCRRLLTRVLLGVTREPRDCWPGLAGWRRRWLARWVFGIRVQDPECPYRLYRREIFGRMPIQ